MEFNQEVDSRAQASNAVTDRELIEILVIGNGNANVNFFCVGTALGGRTGRYFCIWRIRRSHGSTFSVHG